MNDAKLIFNSSILSEQKYTDTEFLNHTVIDLEDILKEAFPGDRERQKIIKTKNGLNFACPYCADSAFDSRKKRGWFLLTGKFAGHYKCFNCGKYTSIPNFFKNWNKEIDLNSIDYLNDLTNNIDTTFETANLTEILINKEDAEKYAIKKDVLIKRLGLQEIMKGNAGYNYLIKRCQYNFKHFLYDPKGQYIVIMNLMDDNKVFGIQVRDITGKRKSKYLTLSLQKMHDTIYKDNAKIPDDLERLSLVFNIFNVDIYKPVLLTEGPFDAFLLKNCIASAGAGKSIPLDLSFYYVYDSDKTGNQHAIEKLNEGNYVFLWDKLKNDLRLPNKKKWDINDVFIWLRNNNIKTKINFMQYFSNDALSILDI